MKKIFAVVICLFVFANTAFASKESEKFIKNYENAQLPNFELVQDLDPYQVEDYYRYAWAPYPLFRTSVDLYFKGIHILPGYYILTPREVKDNTYVFFKQAGKVIYIIPVGEKDLVNPLFYKEKTPVPKRNMFGKIYAGTRKHFYNIFKKSKKMEPPSSYIEVSTIDNVYIQIDLYYGATRYSMYFKSVPEM